MSVRNRRIDSHVHFWKIARGDYHWMKQAPKSLHRNFGPDDLRPLLDAVGLTEVIVVQAAATVAETEYLLSLAHDVDFISGVVGWVDLQAPDVAGVLNRLSADSYFKGIRPMIQDIVDPTWMLRDELSDGLNSVIEKSLTFECLVTPVHLPHLVTFLRRYPELKAIIDHGAKPNIVASEFKEWAEHMQELATDTAVLCKFSGLVTEAGEQWSVSDLRPFTDHLIECFGPDRLVFGSDWPVVTLAASYQQWFDSAQALLGGLPTAELAKIFGENAAHLYALQSS